MRICARVASGALSGPCSMRSRASAARERLSPMSPRWTHAVNRGLARMGAESWRLGRVEAHARRR